MNFFFIFIIICILASILYIVNKCLSHRDNFVDNSSLYKNSNLLIAARRLSDLANHYKFGGYPDTYPSKDGETIFVKVDNIQEFVDNYLPNIKYKFVLVSGESDYTLPDHSVDSFNTIRKHPLLIKWYLQNYNENPNDKDDRLKHYPIGLDFHTLSSNPLWGPIQTPEEQENDINTVKKLIKFENRLSKCYSNFHFFLSGKYCYDRQNAIDQIPKDLIYYEPTKIDRIESWKNMIKHKFVVSPLGNGIDCHRTWEALALGCIPIVKKSPLDPLYNGLPVIIVNEWSDVTQDLLDSYNSEGTSLEKMYMKYWYNEFNI